MNAPGRAAAGKGTSRALEEPKFIESASYLRPVWGAWSITKAEDAVGLGHKRAIHHRPYTIDTHGELSKTQLVNSKWWSGHNHCRPSLSVRALWVGKAEKAEKSVKEELFPAQEEPSSSCGSWHGLSRDP